MQDALTLLLLAAVDDKSVLPVFLYVTAGFAIGLLAWVVLSTIQQQKEQELEEKQDNLYSPSPLFKAIYPTLQRLGKQLETVRALEGLRRRVRKQLLHAGKSLVITPDEFIAWMVVWGGVGAFAALYCRMLFPQQVDITIGAGFVLGFMFLIYSTLVDQVKRRQKEIRKILPYTLDLLCLSVEAGLDFTAALNRIGDHIKKNALRDELKMLGQDLLMGKTRAEALRDMERRIGIEELTSVVSALIQADELGSGLGRALRIQSEELQRVRFQKAEKKAMQAPVLMLIPLVLFIFPLVFLIIFAPIAIKIWQQFTT